MKNLLIWDSPEKPINNCGPIYLWSSPTSHENDESISIPSLVESKDIQIRDRFLRWHNNLRKNFFLSSANRKTSIMLRPNFNFWWLTLIAEKCNFSKSPNLDQVIKILAFEEDIKGKFVQSILLNTKNSELQECFQNFCKKKGINLTLLQTNNVTKYPLKKLRNFSTYFFSYIFSWIWLLYFFISFLPVLSVGLKKWNKTKGKITFISYSDNSRNSGGILSTPYWGRLPNVLQKKNIKTNWIHLYVPDNSIHSPFKARKFIKEINSKNNSLETHILLESFLSISVLFKTLRDIRVCFSYRNYFHRSTCELTDSEFNFWPLIKTDWSRSVSGPQSAKSLLYFNLFERASGSIDSQLKCVYLQENQPWERALIYFWKVSGHGDVIGFPHTAVRFWDLRYHDIFDEYKTISKNFYPIPDFIASSGELNKSALIAGGQDIHKIIDVEYLRSDNSELSVNNVSRSKKNILILGDYLDENSIHQIKLCEDVFSEQKELLLKYNLTFKPHPNSALSNKNFSKVSVALTQKPLQLIIHDFDIILTTNVSASSIEAYFSGSNLAIIIDPIKLNLSPLKNIPGIAWIRTSSDFRTFLHRANTQNQKIIPNKSLLYFSKDLEKWTKLIDFEDE